MCFNWNFKISEGNDFECYHEIRFDVIVWSDLVSVAGISQHDHPKVSFVDKPRVTEEIIWGPPLGFG